MVPHGGSFQISCQSSFRLASGVRFHSLLSSRLYPVSRDFSVGVPRKEKKIEIKPAEHCFYPGSADWDFLFGSIL